MKKQINKGEFLVTNDNNKIQITEDTIIELDPGLYTQKELQDILDKATEDEKLPEKTIRLATPQTPDCTPGQPPGRSRPSQR